MVGHGLVSPSEQMVSCTYPTCELVLLNSGPRLEQLGQNPVGPLEAGYVRSHPGQFGAYISLRIYGRSYWRPGAALHWRHLQE